MSVKEFTPAAVIAAIKNATIESKTIDKLSTGKVGCTPERAKIAGKPVDIMLVYGEVQGIQTGEDKRTGTEWTALKGKFWAVKTDEPGTCYQAGLLFMPAGQAMLEAATVTGELDAKDRPVFARTQFAVMCVAVPASNARGYSWELRSLIKAERPPEDSVEAQLLAKMETQFALPAPEKEKPAKG